MFHRGFRLSALFAVGVCTTTILAQEATQPDRITRSVTAQESIALNGHVSPLAKPEFDEGAVAPETPMPRMRMLLKRTPTQEQALDDLLERQQDRLSASYHQWLTPEAFGARFGATQNDIAAIREWLQGHGFAIDEAPQSRSSIVFSGTAAQVQEAFQSPIHSFLVNGRLHRANVAEPRVPAAFAPAVSGILGLTDFRPRPVPLRPESLSPGGTHPNLVNGNGDHVLSPNDFATIYNVKPLWSAGITGTGQTVGIIGVSDILQRDFQLFQQMSGLPVTGVTVQYALRSSNPGTLDPALEAEANLDVEWAGGVAPGAWIKLIVAETVTDAAAYAVDWNVAPILGVSWDACEQYLGTAGNQFFRDLWAQAAAQGISVVTSAGDSGTADCDMPSATTAAAGAAVNGLASTPYNVAVGGTLFDEGAAVSQYWSSSGEALGYIPEVVWNESALMAGGTGLWATGGGASSVHAKPAWQSGQGVPNDGARDVPDVSLSAGAHDCYLLVTRGETFCAAGTSVSAPAFAGLLALVNQVAGSAQGNANFVLYPLAAQHPEVFHDIVSGSNSVPGITGFSAGPGYDLATGWGSLDAAKLVNTWPSIAFRPTQTTLSVTPTQVVHGQNLQFTASTKPIGGTGTPTGNVDIVVAPAMPGFLLGAFPAGQSTLSAAVSDIDGGFFSVSARYGGDGTFGASTSNAVQVTITPEPTVTTIAPSATDANVVSVTVASKAGSGVGLPTRLVSLFADGALVDIPHQVQPSQPGQRNGTALAQFSLVGLPVGAHTLKASYGLDDPSFQGSNSPLITAQVVAQPAPDFDLALSSTSLSVKQGGTVLATIVMTPHNGFHWGVTLSMSGLPQGASYDMNRVAIGGPSAPNLTSDSTRFAIITTGASPRASLLRWTTPVVFAGILLLAVPTPRRRSLRHFVLAALFIGIGLSFAGCGGATASSRSFTPSAPTTGVPTTPPGTYAVTITATANGAVPVVTHSATLKLTVTQ